MTFELYLTCYIWWFIVATKRKGSLPTTAQFCNRAVACWNMGSWNMCKLGWKKFSPAWPKFSGIFLLWFPQSFVNWDKTMYVYFFVSVYKNFGEWKKNKPKRVFGLQVRCRELDVFKILEIFWEIDWKFFGFFGYFLRGFFWRNS